MILSFKRDMMHNYMVAESEEALQKSDYQIHMLTENRIAGLLECSVKKINAKERYFYDITSRQSMANIYEKEYIGADDIRILIKGLYAALMETKKYLLDSNRVVLEPEMIYMDIETKEPLFCYLPVYEGDIHQSFAKLSEYLMRRLDQADSRAVLLGYEVYRRSMEENYSLERLLKKVAFEMQPEEGHPFERRAEEAAEGYTAGGSKRTYVEEVREDSREQERTGIREGSREREWTGAPKNSREREETGVHGDSRDIEGTDGLKGRKKKEQTGNRKKERRRRREKNRGTEGVAEGEGNKKKKGKGAAKKAAAILAALLAAAAVGAAAWIWELNMTQLGGISFLLICLIGYGCSVEAKRKKKEEEKIRIREEKADRQSMKKMQDAYRAEQQKKRDQASAPEREKADKPQTIGATVLLDKGEEAYEPHLSLISMNPRERNSIVLLNDSYMIGKLKSRADICIDHPSISRIHAKIIREGKDYYLYDLNSTNGTFVNGERLAVNERVMIRLSDEIRFADLGYYVGRC